MNLQALATDDASDMGAPGQGWHPAEGVNPGGGGDGILVAI
jgi:hypothetical protein